MGDKPHEFVTYEALPQQLRDGNSRQSVIQNNESGESSTSSFTKATSLDSQNRHLFVQTGEASYILCNLCGYACKYSSAMKRHDQIHSEERPYKCDECGITFRQASHLKPHMLSSHKRFKRFKCSNCDYVTFYKSNLKKHLSLHTEEKARTLYLCDYECKQPDSMKQHQLVPSKENPRKRDECKSTFTDAKSLKAHKQSVHGVVKQLTVKCSTCDFVCKRSAQMKRHELVHRVMTVTID